MPSEFRLNDLFRRIDRAIDSGRGINLTSDDLGAFVASGAYRTLCEAAVQQREEESARRTAGRAGSAKTVRSEIAPEAAEEALDRAFEACGRPRRPTG